nr:STAS domain-containing protein [Nocardioides flavescens]
MAIDVADSGNPGEVVVRLDGPLDLTTHSQLRRAFYDDDQVAAARAVVVDLTAVPFIDSAGIGALATGRKVVGARNGSLALVATDGPVRRLLRVTAMDQALPVFATLDEATAPS